jgi:hypothetical protein
MDEPARDEETTWVKGLILQSGTVEELSPLM